MYWSGVYPSGLNRYVALVINFIFSSLFLGIFFFGMFDIIPSSPFIRFQVNVALSIMFGIFGGAYIVWRSIDRVPRLEASDEPWMYEPRTVVIGPEGYQSMTPSVRNLVSWSGIVRIAESKEQILLFVGKITAYIIPKSAFADVGQAQEFFNLAVSYWNAGKGKRV